MQGRAGRIVLWLAMLAVLVIAWRAQHAFQFAEQRTLWGWRMVGASAALWLAWLAATRGAVPAVAAGSRRLETLAALALCGLGVAFRVVHFDTVPAGMNHDAAFNGMYALHILQGADYTPYVSAAWGRETLFMYLCAALVAWFGNVPEPIQIAATLVGVVTLPIFYLFARAVAGPRLALIGLALLAVSGWHVVFSRVGWRMFMVPPFEMLALLGLWRGLAGRRWGWLLAGAGAAGAIYTYDAGRVVPAMLAVLFVLAVLADRARWRERAVGAALMVATFAVVGAPMLYYAATHPEQFAGRAAHLAEGGGAGALDRLVTNVRVALSMFNHRGNGNDFFIDEPLLEPLVAVLFLLGLLVTLTRARGGAERFLLGGFALALLPGVLAEPNGNRCITALPFVFLFAATGLAGLADAARLLLPGRAGRLAAPALIGLAVAVAGAETWAQFLGAQRRPMLGFGPEATAAGQYLRGFDDRYTRYVVAEDWPEYTLAYLSYNGGGTPLENHYTLGRRLEDIEARINRYGRRGLVFATDLKPAGREAFERLSRLFAEHRREPITAARLGGATVGMALIVEPHHVARTGPWSNTSRALSVGGADAARAVLCFAPVGHGTGVTLRLQIMRPAAGGAGEVGVPAACPPRAGRGPQPLTLGFGAGGLEVRGRETVVAVPAAAVEDGRWYELVVALGADGVGVVHVDGRRVASVTPAAPLGRLTGLVLGAAKGAQFFVDDIGVAPGLLSPEEARWSTARPDSRLHTFEEDFEATPYGRVVPGGGWRAVDGPVAALASPAPAPADAAPGLDGGNAFDGGHGTGPGQFDQPVGIAVAPGGRFFVADRNNHRVQAFARDGALLRAWGGQGNAPGQFREPHDVAADDEFVYVADLWNQRVQAFDHDGRPAFVITGSPTLTSPRGLAAHDRHVFIAEAGAGRVTEYDRNGTLVRTFGSPGGDGPGHLIEPVDVAVAPNGDVWVVNAGNNRLERFGADGRSLGSLPIAGWSGTRLKEVALTVDADGILYLSDWDRHGVRRFRPDGAELEALGSAMREPAGVALDGERLLVAARGDDVVRVVELPR